LTPEDKARAEFQLLSQLAADPLFQGALQRYAHANGSSQSVAIALLTSGRYWTLRSALDAAVHALRSYQFSNGSPDLARGVADLCEASLILPAPGDPAPAELLKTLSELTELARAIVPASAHPKGTC
jgi:hypothetical protein